MADFNILVGVQSGDAIRQLSNVEKGVQRVGNATNRTTQRLKQHANQYNSTAVATNKWAKGALQQAGYQIGDFAVQVQGGTNALQAFGQQGSQLLGIFGPIGAVLGAGVAIAAALGTAFSKMGDATDKAKEELDDLTKSAAESNAELQAVLRGLSGAKEFEALERIRELKKEEAKLNDRLFNREMQLDEAREKGRKKRAADLEKMIQSDTRAMLRVNDKILIEREYIDTLRNTVEMVTKVKNAEDLMTTMATARTVAGQKMLDLMNGENTVMSQIIPKSQLVKDFEEERTRLREGRLNRLFREEQEVMSQTVGISEDLMKIERKRASIRERMIRDEIRLRFRGEEELMQMPVEIDQAAFNKTEQSLKKVKKEAKETIQAFRGFNPELKRIEGLADSVGSSFESAFMSAMKGTMNVRDAFRAMAVDIIAELYRVFVVKQITGFIQGLVLDMAGMPVQGPNLPGRANGGPVSAGKPYIVGERGPELMIPGSSGTVVPNNRLGGGGVVVNQTINVTTGVQQTVRNEIQTLLPQIAEASKAAVMDARRRGGSFANAF